MPIYDYVCQSCGSEFELLTSKRGSDADIAPCSDCGEESRRQISVPAGIVVTGSQTPVRRHTRRTPGVGGAPRQQKPVDTAQIPWVDRQGGLREAGTGKRLVNPDGSKGG